MVQQTHPISSQAGMIIHTGTNDAEAGHMQDVPVQGFTWTWYYGPFGLDDPRSSTHLLLSAEKADAKLIKRELVALIGRTGNPIVTVHANYLPTQGEGEDRMAVDLVKWKDVLRLRRTQDQSLWDVWADIKIPLEHTERGNDDLMFVSVFDGHGGSPAVAELARRTFNACLAWALAGVPQVDGKTKAEDMIRTISLAFRAWDKDVLNAPLHFLNGNIAVPPNPILQGFPNPSLAVLADTAVRGCCALNAVVNVKGGKLYVSHMGDSRAVLGSFDRVHEKWVCDVLTADHRGDDPAEAERVRAAHPDESDVVMLDQGHGVRVLGSRQPTRTLAGSTYNHSLEESARLEKVLDAKRMKTDHPVRTPPYKIDYPDIAVRDLIPRDGTQLRFLIFGTDGLWDRITSEEACLLVAAHRQHPHHSNIPKSFLPSLFPLRPPSIPRPYPAQAVPGARGTIEGEWVFMDDNAATHLIRNGLGSRGWCEDTRRRVLSMEGGFVKTQRDDTTAVVVFFDENGQISNQRANVDLSGFM